MMSYETLFWTVWQRDQGRCFHCGAIQQLELHHLIPKSVGGEDISSNCIIVCGPKWHKDSCHYKIHAQIKTHKKYICTGFWQNTKLTLIQNEINRRTKRRVACQKL